jgi:proline iminopeptidase
LQPPAADASIPSMPTFSADDGTRLAYHLIGDGEPLLCVPGGPMRASVYLGNLGGLSAHRQLILLDLRGTGDSSVARDDASYRCDYLADDVRALQDHLGLGSCDLLAHSAGANIALQYAARHPDRIARLALITPGARAVGLAPEAAQRREIVQLRRDEPWFADAAAAFDRVADGSEADEDWDAIAPFFYGRWDAAARAHSAAGESEVNEEAAGIFAADGAFDPPATRAALASFAAPVLVLAGGFDLQWPPAVVAGLAAVIPAAQLAVQAGAGHYPWLDDPASFVATVNAFLAEAS